MKVDMMLIMVFYLSAEKQMAGQIRITKVAAFSVGGCRIFHKTVLKDKDI